MIKVIYFSRENNKAKVQRTNKVEFYNDYIAFNNYKGLRIIIPFKFIISIDG